MSDARPSVVWFRNDLRVADNPALMEAARTGAPLVCVYIDAPDEAAPWPPGAASRWWLHHSLRALDAELRALGQRLVIRHGPTDETLLDIASVVQAGQVFVNHLYEPALARRDRRLADALGAAGVQWHAFHGNLWSDPQQILTKDGNPYRVFTPFWRALQKRGLPDRPLPRTGTLPAAPHKLATRDLDALRLLPRIPWDAGLRANWQPGATSAIRRLHAFLDAALPGYPQQRDVPSRDGTSRLSPHLHFGEISPRQIAHVVNEYTAHHNHAGTIAAAEHLLREIGWREFAHYILHHFPHTTDAPLDPRFERFPWQTDETEALRRWQHGQTGIPLVDAGMRELWHTGWMHNRVRMVVASFLTKHLLVHWKSGARWFWDTLVDADLASNTLNWQWCAGCGADAAPYFRVFNPVAQGQKFDPHGTYVRQWVPELRGLSSDWIHQPWTAPAAALREAGINLGGNYPAPLVSPADGRKRALDAYATWKLLKR